MKRSAIQSTIEIDFSRFDPAALGKLVGIGNPGDPSLLCLLGNPDLTAEIARGTQGNVLTSTHTSGNNIFFVFFTGREIADVHVERIDGGTGGTIKFMSRGDFDTLETKTVSNTTGVVSSTTGSPIQGIWWEGGKIAISKIVHRNV